MVRKIKDKKSENRTFLLAAGGWSDIDAEKLIKDIHKSRKIDTKWDISFD